MSDNVHQTAVEGFKSASFYDQHRPSYTNDVLDHVCDNLYSEPCEGIKYHILELGAGTGVFTKQILEKLHKGDSYLATDPVESFLSVLKQKVPGVEANLNPASEIPLPDSSVQNIVCAQCFHWFATEESLKEMTRVLVPGGRIILVWNHRDRNVDWVKEAENILTIHYGGTPRVASRQWKTVLESLENLTPLKHELLRGDHTIKGDKDFAVNHFMSISVIARLEIPEKDVAHAQFKAILDKYFKNEQQIHIPFLSEFYCTEKRY